MIHEVFGHPDCHHALWSVTVLWLLLPQLSRVPKNISPLLPALCKISWGLARWAEGDTRECGAEGREEDLPQALRSGAATFAELESHHLYVTT